MTKAAVVGAGLLVIGGAAASIVLYRELNENGSAADAIDDMISKAKGWVGDKTEVPIKFITEVVGDLSKISDRLQALQAEFNK